MTGGWVSVNVAIYTFYITRLSIPGYGVKTVTA